MDMLAGRRDDIIMAFREHLPPCELAVEERGTGEYAVTLPSWAAREIGVGTSSLIPEWRLTTALGVQAEISSPLRRTTSNGRREMTAGGK